MCFSLGGTLLWLVALMMDTSSACARGGMRRMRREESTSPAGGSKCTLHTAAGTPSARRQASAPQAQAGEALLLYAHRDTSRRVQTRRSGRGRRTQASRGSEGVVARTRDVVASARGPHEIRQSRYMRSTWLGAPGGAHRACRVAPVSAAPPGTPQPPTTAERGRATRQRHLPLPRDSLAPFKCKRKSDARAASVRQACIARGRRERASRTGARRARAARTMRARTFCGPSPVARTRITFVLSLIFPTVFETLEAAFEAALRSASMPRCGGRPRLRERASARVREHTRSSRSTCKQSIRAERRIVASQVACQAARPDSGSRSGARLRFLTSAARAEGRAPAMSSSQLYAAVAPAVAAHGGAARQPAAAAACWARTHHRHAAPPRRAAWRSRWRVMHTAPVARDWSRSVIRIRFGPFRPIALLLRRPRPCQQIEHSRHCSLDTA